MAMNLRELEIFRAIMRGGSITEAARILNVSQPAVSTALRHAEDQLGMKLFRREGGRIHPTAEAKNLYPQVEGLFEKMGAIQRYADDLREAHAGLVSVASTPTLSYALVTRAVTRLRNVRPKVRVLIEVARTRDIVDQAATRQIDVGLISTPTQNPGVLTEDLGRSELVCVMRATHPLVSRPFVTPNDVTGYPLITNTRHPLFHKLQRAFSSSGVDIEPSISIAANHNVTSCLLVEQSDCVAIVDPWIDISFFKGIVRKRFRPRIDIRPRMITSRTHPLSRAARLFVDLLREEAAVL